MRCRFLTVIFVLVTAASARGEGDSSLDLRTAERLALRNDPRLQPLLVALDTADAERRALKSPIDPQARVAYRENSRTTEGADLAGMPTPIEEEWEEYEYGVRFFPRHPLVLKANKEAAWARVQVTEAQLRQAEWQITMEVRRTFAQVQYFRSALEFAERLVGLSRARHQAALERRQGGQGTSLDAAAAGMDYLDAIADRDQLEQELTLAAGTLAGITGLEDVRGMTFVEGARAPDSDPRSLDPEELQLVAAEHRMDLQTVSRQLAAARADLRAARRADFPWPSHIQFSYLDEASDTENETWSIQAAIDIPVVSLYMGGGEQVPSAQIRQYQAELTAARERVAREVRDARRALVEAWTTREEFVRSARGLLSDMQEALETAEQRADVGVDARANAEERLIMAERSLLDSDHRYYQAWTRVEEVLGRSLDHSLADLTP